MAYQPNELLVAAVHVVVPFQQTALLDPLMSPDDQICLCFHVTRRKLVNFCRRELPRVPSQLSECGGAGTGCGWCIPFLKRIYAQEMEKAAPDPTLDMAPEEYAKERLKYHAETGRRPPDIAARDA